MVADGATVVLFEDVGLRYVRAGQGADDEVLHDLNFALPEGSFRWLLGPSGAGKTSLLRLMYLAVRPTRGRLTVLGTEVGAAPRGALPRLRRRIGVVFQDFRLLRASGGVRQRGTCRCGWPAGRRGRSSADVMEMLALGRAGGEGAPKRGGRRNCPAASSSAWRSPAPWSAGRSLPAGRRADRQSGRRAGRAADAVAGQEMNRLGATVIVRQRTTTRWSARHPAPGAAAASRAGWSGRDHARCHRSLARPDRVDSDEWA